MDVSPLVWWLTIGITTRRPDLRRRDHRPAAARALPQGGQRRARRSSSGWRSSSASAIWVFAGHQYGTEFFAGWLTEYSLSVDNLFIFLIIMTKFAVPRELQQSALLVGIVLALIMRGIFIAVGAAAINNFSWIFYVFGLFLVWTACKLASRRSRTDDDEYEENRLIKFVERQVPGHLGVARQQDPDQGERQARDHADVHRDPRAGHHRPAVRARLDPGDLRPDRGAVHRAHCEHLRADGPAPARTSSSAGCSSAWCTSPTAWRSCWASSA